MSYNPGNRSRSSRIGSRNHPHAGCMQNSQLERVHREFDDPTFSPCISGTSGMVLVWHSYTPDGVPRLKTLPKMYTLRGKTVLNDKEEK